MLTAQGFQRKTYEEYIEELEQQARELFGPNVNLSENGPMGKWIRLQAYGRAEESELTEQVYLSAFVDHAEGVSLDYAVKNSSISRIQATKAVGSVNLTVTPGSTIEAGIIVATVDNIEFVTMETVTDSANAGVVSAPIEAVDAGIRGNVPANTIVVINTPVAGLESVTNPAPTKDGRDQETDKELRDRHEDAGANSLSSTVNGIRAAVLNEVLDVTSVIIIENDENTPDAAGRPPNSFETIVYGGNADDIAAAILKAKPAGIRAYGSTNKIVKDDAGEDKKIAFSFAASVPIYAKITIAKNASFPVNGNDLIKTEIVKYIGGTDADGKTYSGLGMGQSVVNMQAVFAIIRNVPGVDDVAITFSTNGTTYAGGNVTIDIAKVAQTSFDKVVVL